MVNIYLFLTTLVVFGFCYTDAKFKKSKKGSDPEFCSRGFQLSSRYYNCWKDATYEHRYTQLDHAAQVYNSDVLEHYALHMCSVVKPAALSCFSNEISQCSKAETLYEMADSSGGTCAKNVLNPAFKSHIIDHLKPVPSDSPCFGIADEARTKCYDVGEYIPTGSSSVDIKDFNKIANKIFSHIWECHVTMFRQRTDKCPHWQIPMLFSLQQSAMTSLFGMKLNLHQIAMLDLGDVSTVEPGSPIPVPDNKVNCEKTLLLMRVIKNREEADRKGDIVIEMAAGEGGYELSSGKEASEAVTFFRGIINSKGGINMRLLRERAREMKAKIKENKKEAKEIEEFLDNIQQKKMPRTG